MIERMKALFRKKTKRAGKVPYEIRMNILIGKVLEMVRENANGKLPQKGKFTKFSTGFYIPDSEYMGFVRIEPGTEPEKRVANVSVYRQGTDRVVSNLFFFNSTQEILEWLEAKKTVAEVIDTCHQLKARVAEFD